MKAKGTEPPAGAVSGCGCTLLCKGGLSRQTWNWSPEFKGQREVKGRGHRHRLFFPGPGEDQRESKITAGRRRKGNRNSFVQGEQGGSQALSDEMGNPGGRAQLRGRRVQGQGLPAAGQRLAMARNSVVWSAHHTMRKDGIYAKVRAVLPSK